MKLASFLRDGRASFGAVTNDVIRDFGPRAKPASTLRDYLPAGLSVWQKMSEGVEALDIVPLAEVTLLAPVPDARKYLGLGGNYASHMEEARKVGLTRTAGQVWFNKQVSCINGPYAFVERPRVSEQLDYEGELGVVIGRDCRHVTAADAFSVIAGYVVCNDFSVRDWQMRAPTHTLGKSFDTHGPFGPWLVSADEVPNPHVLMLRVSVNGEPRQQSSTSEMTYKIPQMIVELTTAFTLQAGDVLSTGSPAGVGGLMDPPRYLRDGDRVRVEIENIGYIENQIVNEPMSTSPPRDSR